MLCQSKRNEVIAAYQAGELVASICKRLGCCKMTVWNFVRQANIPPRQKPHHIPPRNKTQRAAVVAAYREGKNLEDVGSVCGITRERVRQILNSEGIKPDRYRSSERTIARLAERDRQIVRLLKSGSTVRDILVLVRTTFAHVAELRKQHSLPERAPSKLHRVVDGVKEKFCKGCARWLPCDSSSFYFFPSRKDASYYCKKCHKRIAVEGTRKSCWVNCPS